MDHVAGINLPLTPLCFEDAPDLALSGRAVTPIDAKTSFAFFGSKLNVHAVPSPLRPSTASPLGLARMSPAASPVRQASPTFIAMQQTPTRSSPVPSPVGQASPTYAAAQQQLALHAKCRIAEQKHQESQERVAVLEREVQDLRAKLELAKCGEGEKTQAIWNAATKIVGESNVLQEVRAKDSAWLADARARFEEQHCTELWRLLRGSLSVGAFSDVARSIGGGPLGVGKLLFDAVPAAQPALERRHSQFISRDVSQPPCMTAVLAKPPRAASRPSMPTRAATVTMPVAATAAAPLRQASPSVRDRIHRLESGKLL